MGFFMNILELPDAVMRINLRGSQAAVAKEFLDGVQPGTAVHEVRGKSMPQHVGAAFVECGGDPEPGINQQPGILGV